MSLPGPMELLIILAIVALLFGTKKIRTLGGDLGGAIKSFKKAINEDEQKKSNHIDINNDSDIIEGDVKSSTNSTNKD